MTRVVWIFCGYLQYTSFVQMSVWNCYCSWGLY